jgi:hypothetical protein
MQLFSLSLPFALFVFTLLYFNHILSPCYACFGRFMGIKGI